jgi:type II secretory pathway component GspD/PulD (secretin)
MIEEVLAHLDVPVPQAMFEVEILDVSKGLVDNLGFDFGENPLTLILPGTLAHKGARFFMGDLNKRGGNKWGGGDEKDLAGSIILGNTYAGLLDFLRTQSDTKILARPRILTLNNETAEIKIETDEVVGREREESSESGNLTYEAERAKTGVSLRVTPQINLEMGEITMFILPAVKQAFDSTIKDEDGQAYKNIEERGTKSMVRVRDGDTVIIGGLIRKEFSQAISKLPILGDIPVLGALFRHKTKDKDLERELLIFITPHIVGEASSSLAKVSSAILSSREQDIP